MPMAFHAFGADAGRIFLPMHIPVLLSGFVLGPLPGAIIGAVGPLLSSAITGMPAGPMLISMPIELCLYGLVSGLFFYKLKWNVYLSLVLSMIIGRAVLAGILLVLTDVFHIKTIGPAAVFSSVGAGIPGIVIQILFIPLVVMGLKKIKGLNPEQKAMEG
jgi:LytS/YehU family sensor histidine kinase